MFYKFQLKRVQYTRDISQLARLTIHIVAQLFDGVDYTYSAPYLKEPLVTEIRASHRIGYALIKAKPQVQINFVQQPIFF